METIEHIIKYTKNSYLIDYSWTEKHNIMLKSDGKKVFLEQYLYKTNEPASIFMRKHAFVVEFYLPYSYDDQDEIFFTELENLVTKAKLPFEIDMSFRVGFSTLEDALSFMADHLEIIKKMALDSFS